MTTESSRFSDKTLVEDTVFVVDDDETLRSQVCALARSAGLAAEAYSSAEEFLGNFDDQKCACLVLDICMPGMGGLELQSLLNSRGGAPPIIFVTAYGEIALASQTIRAGAVDFIQKPFRPLALLHRIHEAMALDRQKRRRRASVIEAKQRIAGLTAREFQILPLLAAGESAKRIASRLSISVKTVDNHRLKILEKMLVENTTQLARFMGTIV